MRISADTNNPAYHHSAHKCEVYLDGAKLNNCVTADDEKGEVFVYVFDKAQRAMFDEKGKGFLLQRKTGRVKIVVPTDTISQTGKT